MRAVVPPFRPYPQRPISPFTTGPRPPGHVAATWAAPTLLREVEDLLHETATPMNPPVCFRPQFLRLYAPPSPCALFLWGSLFWRRFLSRSACSHGGPALFLGESIPCVVGAPFSNGERGVPLLRLLLLETAPLWDHRPGARGIEGPTRRPPRLRRRTNTEAPRARAAP